LGAEHETGPISRDERREEVASPLQKRSDLDGHAGDADRLEMAGNAAMYFADFYQLVVRGRERRAPRKPSMIFGASRG
jgi:hypothetical protein